MITLTETDVEEAALEWLQDLGWQTEHGPDIGPGGPNEARADYGVVVLEGRLRDALARLNSDLPVEALDGAFRKLIRPEGSALEARNRAFHRMLVEGITVEYRTASGRIRGAQAAIIDYSDPASNDFLAVNQITFTERDHTRRPDIVLFVNGLPLGVYRAQEPCRRRRRYLDSMATAPDLPGRAALAVLNERVARCLGWHGSAPWHTHGGSGVVQTVAHGL